MSEAFNMDALLDGTLDDLADKPEFKPFPRGAHICTINIEQKKINDFPAFELKLKHVSTEELADASDAPPAPGAESSVAFFMAHKDDFIAQMGQGQFKDLMKAAAEQFGAKSNRDLIADCQGATALVVTGVRQNKDKTKSFTSVESVRFV